MRELLKKAKPDTFEDLIALVSLYRPGPMDLIPDFIDRKHGVAEVSYPHPLLEPVLAPTYGVVVYQEQVMQTAQILAGYSLGGADLLRRAMGKKKVEEMAKERAKFEIGAKEVHNIAPAVAGPIFDLLEKFAGYGFNKSHAAAYALVSYQTAWLKAHYPSEFMAAVLSSDMDKTEKVVGFLTEARGMGLNLLPPDVNASNYMFDAIDSETIRHGLGAVKGVGQNACEAISEARDADGPFKDVMDFCARVDATRVNRRAIEALVNAGAMDGLGGNRPTLLLQFPEAMKAQEQEAKARAVGQDSLFGGMGDATPPLQVDLPIAADWSLSQRLKAEKESLGLYLSGHPVDPYRDSLVALTGHDLSHLETIWNNRSDQERRGWRPEANVILGGMITALRRRGETQTIATMEDGKGHIECMFFQEELEQFGHMLTQDAILIIEGGMREDDFNGGFSLRARKVWNFREIHPAYAERILVRLDARDKDVPERFLSALKAFRPGLTPLRIELLRDGVRGAIDLRAPNGVLPDIELPGTLRAVEGVQSVAVSFRKPW
jgi:DNA polymerase-3 subunit alpha